MCISDARESNVRSLEPCKRRIRANIGKSQGIKVLERQCASWNVGKVHANNSKRSLNRDGKLRAETSAKRVRDIALLTLGLAAGAKAAAEPTRDSKTAENFMVATGSECTGSIGPTTSRRIASLLSSSLNQFTRD
jgi:hypothetical protein